jgi:hypothetical protein
MRFKNKMARRTRRASPFKRRASPRRTLMRVSRRRSKPNFGGSLFQFDAMLYGAGRTFLSNLASPLTARLGPLGGFADELVLLGATYFTAKKTGGFVRQVATKGLIVENAMIGRQLGEMVFNRTPSVSNTQSIKMLY